MLEVLEEEREQGQVPERKICPIRALAYTVAKVPNKVQEPYCIGERCAWFIPTDEGLGDCAIKRLTWP